jgi:hypothetical protein
MKDRLKLLIDDLGIDIILTEAEKQHIADYLINSGVIVPPVKLGSKHKVYIPIKGTTVVYDTKVYGIGIDEDGDMVINPKEYPEEVMSINCYNVGKTVFFTREQAEKALERSENGKS